MLALRVTADFEPKIRDGRIAVEDIQDSVEKVLSEAGYADVAKAYILYRCLLYTSRRRGPSCSPASISTTPLRWSWSF